MKQEFFVRPGILFVLTVLIFGSLAAMRPVFDKPLKGTGLYFNGNNGGVPVKKKKVVIGYVGGYKGLVKTDHIAAEKLTHINYAFVNVKNNRAFLNRPGTDTVNFKNLIALKEKNPALKILISIGGWTWSKNFSDASLTDTARRGFAASAVALIKKYKLDGVDVDWEYPGIPGHEGNVYRKEDKENFTLLLQALREELDAQQQDNKWLLTIAVGGFTNFLRHTEMDKAQQYLDFVNLMTYDFHPGAVAVHHTNLYDSKHYAGNSADKVFKEYVAAGVPAEKLVMGIAFYGRTVQLKDSHSKGIADSVLKASYGKGYTFIKDSLMNKKGYEVFRDKDAKASFIYNKELGELMTFDDHRSVRDKCDYVVKNEMGGVMFWEYDSDHKGYLLGEIHKKFN